MLSAVPAGFPIGIIEAVDTDAFAGGNVDELIFTQVNTAMRRAFLISGEKYEISGLKLGAFPGALTEIVLLVGGARDGEPVLFEDILNKA